MMKNEPVAWATKLPKTVQDFSFYRTQHYTQPLYTHPVKAQKCVVKDCENHKHEGSFNGDVCSPCYQFIAHGKGIHSQAYRNAKPAELTDEEIEELQIQHTEKGHFADTLNVKNFAKAILRKAQEK